MKNLQGRFSAMKSVKAVYANIANAAVFKPTTSVEPNH